jgi:hypothetical protein
MSQSQRSDSHSQYEEPFPHSSAAVPAVTNGQPGQSPPTPAEMRSGSIVRQDPCAATMLLIVGLPGAGKTTRAKELAAANRALRPRHDRFDAGDDRGPPLLGRIEQNEPDCGTLGATRSRERNWPCKKMT